MKGRYAAAAMAASGVYAQAPPAYTTPAPSISYTTVTYDDCPSMSMETMITVTNGITVTYCPECEMHTQTPKPNGPGYTTTYTTTYMSLCPTGMVPKTYTVTESCTEPEPTWTPGPSHIPQGFTVTEKVCHVCDKTPTTVTMTEPCDCEAHEGTPGPAKPVPAKPTGAVVSQIPDGQVQAPPGGSGGNGGSGSTPCNGDDCGGSSNGSTPPSGGNNNGGSGSPPSGGNNGDLPPACTGDDCGGSGNGSTPPSGGNGGSGSPPSGGSGSGETCANGDCNSSSPPAPGGNAGGSTPPYPTTTPCSGAGCRAVPTGGAPGVNYTTPNASGMPDEGMPPPASGASLAVISSSIMAVVVAALAFAL